MRLTKFPVTLLLLFLLTHTIHEHGFKHLALGLTVGLVTVACMLLGLRIISGADTNWRQHCRLEAAVLYLAGIPLGSIGSFGLLIFAIAFMVPSAVSYPGMIGMGLGVITCTAGYDVIRTRRGASNQPQPTQPDTEYHTV
jgi:hypothetical protein